MPAAIARALPPCRTRRRYRRRVLHGGSARAMAAGIGVSSARTSAESIRLEARRLEELALNASGAFQSLVYDGWLLGYRPGPTKRLRCVNAFYSTSLPLAQKVDYCLHFYRSMSLPAIFRMLPF